LLGKYDFIMPDSIGVISSNTLLSGLISPVGSAVLEAFLISVLLLLAVTLCKYYMNTIPSRNDKWNMYLEVIVDIQTVIFTILIAYNYLVESINRLWLLFFMTLIFQYCSIINRRKIISELEKDTDINWWKCVGRILLVVLITLISIVINGIVLL